MRIKAIGALTAAALVATAGGIAASAASAAVFTLSTEECNGTVLNVCWSENLEAASPLLELVGEQWVEVVSTSQAIFKVKDLEIEISCIAVSGLGTIRQTEPLVKTGTIEFTTLTFEYCTLEGALGKKCTIAPSQKTEWLTGSLKTEEELQLKPVNGKWFIKLEFKNNGAEKCPATVIGSHEVTGEQIVRILFAGLHEFTKKGELVGGIKSSLKFSGKAAGLTGGLELLFLSLEDFVEIGKA